MLEASETHMRAKLEVAKGGISLPFVTRNVLVPAQSPERNLEEWPVTSFLGVWAFSVLGQKACTFRLDLAVLYLGPAVLRPVGCWLTPAP